MPANFAGNARKSLCGARVTEIRWPGPSATAYPHVLTVTKLLHTPPRRSAKSPLQSRVLARLQGSPVVGDKIPWQLRTLDIAVAVLALPFVLTVGGVLAIAVFLDSPGPIFYRSWRIGRGGRPFPMLKFRTMRHDLDGPPLSAKGDPRYTPLGRSLAATRLDELPQLLNVFKGDMRLVGPRPEIAQFVEAFPSEYERILSVPPGLTGPAQLRYAREGLLLAEAEDREVYYRENLLPSKVGIDLGYAQSHGVLRDLSILARTVVLPVVQVVIAIRLTFAHARPGGRLVLDAALALVLVLSVLALTGLVLAEAASPS